MKINAALLGYDIGYTRSPKVHAAIARALGIDVRFDVFDVEYSAIKDTVKKLQTEYDGFFITKPYKQDIKEYVSECKTACGVNFVTCKDMVGYNTDGVGFMSALDYAFGDWRTNVNSVLVLGAGGAAYAVTEALTRAGKSVFILNRTNIAAVKLCAKLGAELYANQPAEMIVNATSLGAHGENALAEFCIAADFKYAYDLVYAPPQTRFLFKSAERGARTANGEDMLVYQAIEGDKILLGAQFDSQEVFNKVKSLMVNNQA